MRHILKTVVLAGALALVAGYSDQWDKKTIMTIDAPLQLPTITLQPGSYTVKLLESQSNRHIVGIWDKDGKKHMTTILAIPNYRLQPTGKSQFTMWETPAGQPAALRAWFYPGDTFGQEFAYPKDKWEKMAIVTKEEVPTLTTADETTIAEVEKKVEAAPEPAPTPAPVETAQVRPPAAIVQPEPAPEPVRTAPAQPEPAPLAAVPADEAAALPQTASNWFEITLLGALLGVTGLFLIRKGVSA